MIMCAPILELNKQLMQSKSDLTAEKLSRENLECKLRLVGMCHGVMLQCVIGPVSLTLQD